MSSIKLLPRICKTTLDKCTPEHRFYLEHYIIDGKLPEFKESDMNMFKLFKKMKKDNLTIMRSRGKSYFFARKPRQL